VGRIEQARDPSQIGLALPKHPGEQVFGQGCRGEPDTGLDARIVVGELGAEPRFTDRMLRGHRQAPVREKADAYGER
jgi:hypothetical protein